MKMGNSSSSSSDLVAVLLLLLLYAILGGQSLNCDPCIDRPTHVIHVIVHGTKVGFWHQVRAASLQSARDMRIQLEFDLYDEFDVDQMASDIVASATSAVPPDALVVSIPSSAVHDSIRIALQHGVPVFGLNSGYDVAEQLGVLGFVAMDEYRGGVEAAKQFVSSFQQKKKNITRALFVHVEEGNLALDARYRGFQDGLQESFLEPVTVEQIIVDTSDEQTTTAQMETVMEGCPYDAVLLSGNRMLEFATSAFYKNECLLSTHLLGTFDTNSQVFDAIATGKLAFAVSQQQYLQGALAVVMATIYVTSNKKLYRSAESDYGIHLSGPALVTLKNLPSDTRQWCEADSFPVCPNTLTANGLTESKCDCAERSLFTIGGVVHGITTDSFWDVIFAQARQAADDLGVTLKLDRLEPQRNNDVLHAKMASKIVSLCQEGVDGLFVSIPSADIIPAIQECQALNVPIMSINAGAEIAENLGLLHHISQLEYNAGFGAGQRMVENGMVQGVCVRHADVNVLTERCRGFTDAVMEAGLTMIGVVRVPNDNRAGFISAVENRIEENGDWEGIGMLVLGPSVVDDAFALQSRHNKLLIGTFDTSDEVYAAIDEGLLLFGIDQVPYLQGYMPVWLLATFAHTQQKLANTFIETGPSFVEESPSDALQVCEVNLYQVCPRPVEYDLNQLNRVRPIGLTLGALVFTTSIIFAAWVVWDRNDKVVKKSQPLFLIMVCVGTFIMGSAIIPLSIDDGVTSDEGCDKACMAAPWLFTLGFTIAFAALYSKINRLNRLIHGARRFRRIKVSVWDVMLPFAILLLLNLVFLLVWTLVDPMYWERNSACGASELSSYGRCALGATGVSTAMISCILVLHFCAVVLANIEAYRARNVSTEYSESKYIFMVMLSLLQISIIGIPIMALVNTNPPASFFVKSTMIFAICMSMLLLIFIPKVLFLRKARKEQAIRRASLRQVGDRRRWGLTSSDRLQSDVGLRVMMPRGDSDSFVAASRIHVLERLMKHQGIETGPLFEEAGISVNNASSEAVDETQPTQNEPRTETVSTCVDYSIHDEKPNSVDYSIRSGGDKKPNREDALNESDNGDIGCVCKMDGGADE